MGRDWPLMPTIRAELLPLPKSWFLVYNVEINIRVATVRLERLGKQLCPRSAESFVVLRAPTILQIKHIESRKPDTAEPWMGNAADLLQLGVKDRRNSEPEGPPTRRELGTARANRSGSHV